MAPKNHDAGLFWDVIPGTLNDERHGFFIIERTLEFGGEADRLDLERRFTQGQIAEVVRQSRSLSPRTVNYWCLILGIPREETLCFSRPYPLIFSPF